MTCVRRGKLLVPVRPMWLGVLSHAAALTLCWVGILSSQNRGPDLEIRPVTVRDVISMNRLGLPDGELSGQIKDKAAKFSPDGKKFIVVLKHGNLDRNTNDYSVFLYQTADALNSPRPQVLFTLSSTSNREAIQDIKWLDDSDTLAFIGENPGELPGVYEFSIAKKHLERITTHPTAVVAFDVSADGKTVLFEADPAPRKPLAFDAANASGMVITTQSVIEILADGSRGFEPTAAQGEELFLNGDQKREMQISTDDVLYAVGPLSLSPDGRHALISGFPREIPETWSEYKDSDLQKVISSSMRRKGEAFRYSRYLLLDTDRGELAPLFNTPILPASEDILWVNGGTSFVISRARLSLDGTDATEREKRKEKTYVVEVKLPEKQIVKITDGHFRAKAWNQASSTLLLTAGNWWDEREQQIAYAKEGLVWKEVPIGLSTQDSKSRIKVTLEEGTNSPPKIYSLDAKGGKKVLLLDLNPQFTKLSFGRVEVVTWKATDGHEVQGGLFLPPNYEAGKRYPLVIQTHGYLPGKFYSDGPWSSAFAAQPLAGKGIVVLQVGYSTKHDDDDPRFFNTPQEAPREMAAYEGAIDYLDSRGLIDRDRVGIIGFSRTVYKAAYTLTHSNYQFAAATFADGIDGGLYEYLLFNVQNDPLLNGGPPFGKTLALWIKSAPEFSMDRIRTPIRLEAYSPASALGKWNWFAGLSLQEKPVEFIYLPHATHLLNKPSERIVSQQGNVDWFCFWLKREEDPDPSKAEQYARWRVLDQLQKQTEKTTHNPPAFR